MAVEAVGVTGVVDAASQMFRCWFASASSSCCHRSAEAKRKPKTRSVTKQIEPNQNLKKMSEKTETPLSTRARN